MRAPVVKSPEIFLLAKHTFIDAAEADPSSRPGPRRRSPESSTTSAPLPLMTTAKPDPILSWRLLWSVTSPQATTNSYTCQPDAAEHQMMYALRSASCSPEASEPHLANGFL